jgi:hypothetical protein
MLTLHTFLFEQQFLILDFFILLEVIKFEKALKPVLVQPIVEK